MIAKESSVSCSIRSQIHPLPKPAWNLLEKGQNLPSGTLLRLSGPEMS
jgi:hypothetical protein